MRTTKILFILTMPHNNSWNGHFSGEDKTYARCLPYRKGQYPNLKEGKYNYDFEDGWMAQVEVRFTNATETRSIMKKSVGFMTYDWMIEDLKVHGRILTRKEHQELKELIK